MTHPYREGDTPPITYKPYEVEVIELIKLELKQTDDDISSTRAYDGINRVQKPDVIKAHLAYKKYLIEALLTFLKTDELPEEIAAKVGKNGSDK